MSSVAAKPETADTEQSPKTVAKAETPTGGTADKPAESGDVRMPATDLLRRQMAHCGEYTFQALNKIGKLSPEDTSRITQKYLKTVTATEKGKPFTDALVFLVMEGWQKEEVEARDIMLDLTKALLRYSKTKVSHLAFAHQTDTPIEFYTEFPGISEICRLMGCPITQVSEKDFLTVTAINPFTAIAAATLISNELQEDSGRKPFTFLTTTDFNAWRYCCERHFGT